MIYLLIKALPKTLRVTSTTKAFTMKNSQWVGYNETFIMDFLCGWETSSWMIAFHNLSISLAVTALAFTLGINFNSLVLDEQET